MLLCSPARSGSPNGPLPSFTRPFARRKSPAWSGCVSFRASGRLHRLRDVPIHSCVNLFWNSLNRTFDAFQRNGLLRAAERNDSEHGLLCLLEIDTERLLNEAEVYWTATKGNAASGAFASFEM